MSGRRLRHVNAERKLKDWRHEARERQLEKTAQDYLKRLAKEKRKRREEVVDLGAVRKASHAAMARVADAVKSGMERHGLDKGKRKLSAEEEGEEEAERAQQAKRGKLLGMLEDIEEGEDDEEEDEEEGEEEEDEEEEDEEEEDEEEEDEEHEEGEEGTEKGGEEGSGSGSKEGSEGSGGAGSAGSAGSAGKAVAPLHSSSSDEERDEACHASRSPSAHSSALHHHEPQAQPQQSLGLERLKQELQQRGLKCGGTLSERAARLFLLASTPVDQLDPKHLAGAAGGGKGRKSKGKL
ncbi:unnamed protein product [Closterium sp. NIES-65]|nr:unnamed protein product [Closterium sp. NIES-65]